MSGAGLYERQFEYLLPSHAQEADLPQSAKPLPLTAEKAGAAQSPRKRHYPHCLAAIRHAWTANDEE